MLIKLIIIDYLDIKTSIINYILNRMYNYLDTNVIITLGKKVSIISQCITSSLTIIELFKNLNNGNYIGKRSLFRTINEAKIFIDWDTPLQKLKSAFGYSTTDPLRNKIEQLYDKIIKTDNFTDYNNEHNSQILTIYK